ncbi:MAG TPA: tripartite tricarboxylate transporter substrate binding protein [Xanthobacteraceae bacterium]|nr:tripartite tricarboxylate transporter substrate binding protein [Xanthobacteraceae bacterium]
MSIVTRRGFVAGTSAIAASAAMAGGSALAQSYPTEDIHFICAFAPGSGADVLVRYFAAKVAPLTGRNVIVENKAGAAGQMALEHVARSKPDGHTIFVHAGSSASSSMHLFRKPSVDVLKQIRIAATINQQPYMIVVDNASPHKTLADLTKALKAKGVKASYGVANPMSQIMSELYKVRIDAPTIQVLYKNSMDMMNDLTSGSLEFGSIDPVLALAQQRAGRLRILGISSDKRMSATGDLPTMTEQGVPMDVTGWWAAMVPAGTPQQAMDQINKWFVAVVSSPETKTFLNNSGGDPYIVSPKDAQERLRQEIDQYGEWFKIAKIQQMG